MAKRNAILSLFCIIFLFFSLSVFAQGPAEGENEYRLSAVNPRANINSTDTLDANAGRGVHVASNPDLDGDGLPEILVTNYSDGGRIFVYEVIGNDRMELVWTSKKLSELGGGGSTPRSVTTGDFDNNGLQEIIFPVGYFAADSAEFETRGIYIYEHTGNDNEYGTEPVHKIAFEDIDTLFADVNTGRTESGLRVQDIDGDGKSEMLFPPRSFSFNVAKLYILEVESGSFVNGDAVIENEYTYEAMVQVQDIFPDGYVPVGTEIGDVDGDDKDEIVVAGWQNIGAGAGFGLIEVTDIDTYTDGSIVRLADYSAFVVKADPLIIEADGQSNIFFHGTNAGVSASQSWVVNDIISDIFVSSANVKSLIDGVGFWSAWDWGDQDHPTAGVGDGFDLYLYGGGGRLLDLEYSGTGSVSDSSNYTITEIIDLADSYDVVGGLFNDIYTYPGMDLDADGNRDIVASYKGSSIDTVAGQDVSVNGFHVFMWEWGDSTSSFDPTPIHGTDGPAVITPDDYELSQNYPNPFNPTTSIRFSLPLNKKISLRIYNSLGQEVRTLINSETYSTGNHVVQWDGRNNNGQAVASGVYIYELVFGNFSKSKKMTLLR